MYTHSLSLEKCDVYYETEGCPWLSRQGVLSCADDLSVRSLSPNFWKRETKKCEGDIFLLNFVVVVNSGIGGRP